MRACCDITVYTRDHECTTIARQGEKLSILGQSINRPDEDWGRRERIKRLRRSPWGLSSLGGPLVEGSRSRLEGGPPVKGRYRSQAAESIVYVRMCEGTWRRAALIEPEAIRTSRPRHVDSSPMAEGELFCLSAL